MDLGLFMMPLHNPDRNYTELINEDREIVIAADKLGYAEAWVGEHYSCICEPIVNPLQFFASLVHETKQIKFATGVLNLPQHHPAAIAGDVAQFDHLSKGRFIMGVGPGGLVSDMELFGTMEKNRAEMVTDSVEIIHKIWSSDPPYNIRGKYWDVIIEKGVIPSIGFGPMPKPYQKPYPPLAISCMSPNSSSAKHAAMRGWGVVTANFIPQVHVKSHWEQYAIGCDAAGIEPDRTKWRIARSILVAESDAEASDYLAGESSYSWYYDYIIKDLEIFNMLGVLKPDPNIPDADVNTRNCLDWMVISGSPKTVLDKLVAFVDYVGGPFGSLLAAQKDWDSPQVHKTSMRLLAHEVMPKLKAYCTETAKAA